MIVNDDDALDLADEALLADLRELAEAADPMPAGLPENVKFALAVRMLQAEAAAITHDAALAIRTAGPSTTASIAFSGRTVELLVSASDEPDGRLRIDGWVTPTQVVIEAHAGAVGPSIDRAVPVARVQADDLGRFVLSSLPERRLMFVVRFADPHQAPTITPVVEF